MRESCIVDRKNLKNQIYKYENEIIDLKSINIRLEKELVNAKQLHKENSKQAEEKLKKKLKKNGTNKKKNIWLR